MTNRVLLLLFGTCFAASITCAVFFCIPLGELVDFDVSPGRPGTLASCGKAHRRQGSSGSRTGPPRRSASFRPRKRAAVCMLAFPKRKSILKEFATSS